MSAKQEMASAGATAAMGKRVKDDGNECHSNFGYQVHSMKTRKTIDGGDI